MPATVTTVSRRSPADPRPAVRAAGGGAPARARPALPTAFRTAPLAALLPVLLSVALAACSHTPATGAATDTTGGRVPVASPRTPATTPAVPAPGTPAAHPVARSVPVRLRIPAIGVDTAVMPLGLAADGSVQVPPIAAHAPAGWYDGSPTPGLTGPSVILGHVTVGPYGDGVFRHLSRLRRGDRVTAVLKDGVTVTFAVDAVRTVAKADFPSAAVYGNVDHPALRLITCAGTRSGTGYPDNVVVYASRAPGT